MGKIRGKKRGKEGRRKRRGGGCIKVLRGQMSLGRDPGRGR